MSKILIFPIHAIRKRFLANANVERTKADIYNMDEVRDVRGLVAGGQGGLSPGLMFMLRTIGLNSSQDVYKETVLQTLKAIKEERYTPKKNM